MALKCNMRQRDDVTILDLKGLLSLGEPYTFGPESGVVLADEVQSLIEKGQKKILLNLAGVRFVDSSGIGQLTGAYTTARNRGAYLKLLKPTTQVRNLLKMTKLDSIFDILDDEDEAVKSFPRDAAATA